MSGHRRHHNTSAVKAAQILLPRAGCFQERMHASYILGGQPTTGMPRTIRCRHTLNAFHMPHMVITAIVFSLSSIRFTSCRRH